MSEQLPIGIVPNMTGREYRNDPGICKSELDVFNECPEKYRDLKAGLLPYKSSKAMDFGTLLHAVVLEQKEVFHVRPDTYPPDDKPWNANATYCKDWLADHSDRPVLSQSEVDRLYSVSHAVIADKKTMFLLCNATHREASVFHHDPETGFRLKCRPDIIGENYIADLKTTRDASTRAFSRAILDFRYHVQAALYRRIMRAIGQPREHWYFIIVEHDPLPRVNVRELTQLARAEGEAELDKDLEGLMACRCSGEWPGYSGPGDSIGSIDIPPYGYRNDVEITIGGEKHAL
jgi:exodeoxyribonuclease VIII